MRGKKGDRLFPFFLNAIATILGNMLWIVPDVIADVLADGAWPPDPEIINLPLVAQKSQAEQQLDHSQP
ncbi:MAG: hypothetical protein P0111_09590 [Nitrospira sp.]|nr:hypothetical protein [Nitrospira sp.]